MLPLVTGISTGAAFRLRCTNSSNPRQLLYLLGIFALQLIYETIIATLSLGNIFPDCGLEEQWARLYRDENADAIRRIQDRFNCCGFNTAVDRAWPFPHGRPEDGYGADQCERMYGRQRSCGGPWGQAKQINAGVLFTVATVILVIKVCRVAFFIRWWYLGAIQLGQIYSFTASFYTL
jgi:hypothetical protein